MTPNPNYNFHRDSKNFRDNGTWTEAEWGVGGNGEVYSVFDRNGKQRTGKEKLKKIDNNNNNNNSIVTTAPPPILRHSLA